MNPYDITETTLILGVLVGVLCGLLVGYIWGNHGR